MMSGPMGVDIIKNDGTRIKKKKNFETTTGKVSKRMRKFSNDDVEDNVTNYH